MPTEAACAVQRGTRRYPQRHACEALRQAGGDARDEQKMALLDGRHVNQHERRRWRASLRGGVGVGKKPGRGLGVSDARFRFQHKQDLVCRYLCTQQLTLPTDPSGVVHLRKVEARRVERLVRALDLYLPNETCS